MNNYISYAPEAVIIPLALIALAIVFKRQYLAIFCIILLICLLFFYRGANLPNEVSDSNTMISPCNGRVLKIKEHGTHIQISVFLNIHNIHVQYSPISGKILSILHKEGEFHPAYLFEKSQYNERVETTLGTEFGNITVVQIAGQVARRIVSFLEKGQSVERGEPLGLIKFGSRVDIWIPIESVNNILINEGDYLDIGVPIIQLK
jgi:phosphatidylserine decarboxylase